MQTSLTKRSKQLIWSCLSVVLVVTLIAERIAAERYGWAAFWLIVGWLHALIVWREIRARRGRIGPPTGS
jgi:hypothetical protein